MLVIVVRVIVVRVIVIRMVVVCVVRMPSPIGNRCLCCGRCAAKGPKATHSEDTQRASDESASDRWACVLRVIHDQGLRGFMWCFQ